MTRVQLSAELLSGMGRYGMALAFILYLLYNETTRDDPSPVRALIFIALALLVMLAKYLAVTRNVKDTPIEEHARK